MDNIYDRTIDLGKYKPEPDDDRIICRCEEVHWKMDDLCEQFLSHVAIDAMPDRGTE